jgi:secreted PhoX family phosphatase
MVMSRRRFLGAAAVTAGLAGLRTVLEPARILAVPPRGRFGPLVPDPRGLLALPEGFSYSIVSRAGERMDDGFFVPEAHDGMATFPGPDGRTLLVRNHEVDGGRRRRASLSLHSRRSR